MPENVIFVSVDGARVKSNLVREVVKIVGITEEDVDEAEVIIEKDSFMYGRLVLKDGSAIDLDDADDQLLRAAVAGAPIIAQISHPIAWSSPSCSKGIDTMPVYLLCMKSLHSADDTLEESVSKLRELATSVSGRGDGHTYNFTDGMFHENGQPQLLVHSIIERKGFSALESLIFHEVSQTRWAFLIAACTVNFLSAELMTTADPALLKLCTRLRKEEEPLNHYWDNKMDKILDAARATGERAGEE